MSSVFSSWSQKEKSERHAQTGLEESKDSCSGLLISPYVDYIWDLLWAKNYGQPPSVERGSRLTASKNTETSNRWLQVTEFCLQPVTWKRISSIYWEYSTPNTDVSFVRLWTENWINHNKISALGELINRWFDKNDKSYIQKL